MSLVNGDSDLESTDWVGRRLNKGIMVYASTSVWGKAAPDVLALKPDNPVPYHISLAIFEPLTQSWSSEFVGLSASKSSSPLSH